MTRTVVVVLLALALLGGIWMIDQYVGCNGRGWDIYQQGLRWWQHTSMNVPHSFHSLHLSGPGFQARPVGLIG